MQVITMPKTPEVNMVECMRVTGYAKMMGLATDEEQREQARKLLASGVEATTESVKFLCAQVNPNASRPLAITSAPVPGPPASPLRLPHVSELHSGEADPDDSDLD